MITDTQLKHCQTFGFVILRNVFSNRELEALQDEFDQRSAVASKYVPFDGSATRAMSMTSDATPVCASLLEDPRFLGAAEMIYGDALGYTVEANRYVGDTYWHYDAGAYAGTGIKFAIYLHPVRAETGALRVIPTSHLKPFHDEIGKWRACDYAWIRLDHQDEATKLIDNVPGFVCESDPGDVVAFDSRIYHASRGGSSDRQMCAVNFRRYPRTPQEVEITIRESKHYFAEQDNSDAPWNPKMTVFPDWLDNRDGHAKRQRWIDTYRRFSEMEEGQNGYQVEVRDGKMWVVRAV